MLKVFQNNRGDTLVEVMIAIAILSMVLAASYSLTSKGAQLNQTSKERTQAVAYAQQQAEIITAYSSRDWTGFLQQVNRTVGAKSSFYRSGDTWRSQNGLLSVNPSAADYKVSYTIHQTGDIDYLTSCTAACANDIENILQLKIQINVNWQPVSEGPTDPSGNPIPDSTRLIIKVSKPGAEPS